MDLPGLSDWLIALAEYPLLFLLMVCGRVRPGKWYVCGRETPASGQTTSGIKVEEEGFFLVVFYLFNIALEC